MIPETNSALPINSPPAMKSLTDQVDAIELREKQRRRADGDDSTVFHDRPEPAALLALKLLFLALDGVLDGQELLFRLLGVRVVVVEQLEDRIALVVAVRGQKPSRRLHYVEAPDKQHGPQENLHQERHFPSKRARQKRADEVQPDGRRKAQDVATERHRRDHTTLVVRRALGLIQVDDGAQKPDSGARDDPAKHHDPDLLERSKRLEQAAEAKQQSPRQNRVLAALRVRHLGHQQSREERAQLQQGYQGSNFYAAWVVKIV
ncbi:hypothetical protein KL924_000289 [Ogataea haglerorum]|nr:hypothetical protein KL924_000289 [Ogataea haglerorum]